MSILEKNATIFSRLFHNNYLKMNEDKCHLLITNHAEKCQSATIVMKSSTMKNLQILCGIIIDDQLSFNNYVSILCKKSVKNFNNHVFILSMKVSLKQCARISNLMNTMSTMTTIKLLLISEIWSLLVGMEMLVWMFKSGTVNNRIINYMKELYE